MRVRSPAARTDIPRLAAAHGRLAHLHFGFAARQISVSALNEKRAVALAPGRTVSWPIRQTGFVVISATAPGRGTVSYAVNVQ